jgi:hypothetical protein
LALVVLVVLIIMAATVELLLFKDLVQQYSHWLVAAAVLLIKLAAAVAH